MKVIWKFSLALVAEEVIPMPKERKFLNLQLQGRNPVLWYLVDSNTDMEDVTIVTYMTGQAADDTEKYLGTYQLGPLVFHVFEELK
jgi:hypothetical protein